MVEYPVGESSSNFPSSVALLFSARGSTNVTFHSTMTITVVMVVVVVVSVAVVIFVMFSDEHYNLPTLYMFITIHYVLMYLVVLLSYQMS